MEAAVLLGACTVCALKQMREAMDGLVARASALLRRLRFLHNKSEERLLDTRRKWSRGSASVSVHVKAIQGCAEDVEENKRPHPVLLLVRCQLIVGDHIAEHPSPERQPYD
jgi:hypothetical protein